MGQSVSCLCVALSDQVGIGHLGSEREGGGTAMHALGRLPGQGESVLTLTIDEMAKFFAIPRPNYLKIDVDSIEDRIVAGGSETLTDPTLRSLLIELAPDDPKTERVTDALAAFGFAATRATEGDRINVIFSR
jgi:FkbM family methyltransferase